MSSEAGGAAQEVLQGPGYRVPLSALVETGVRGFALYRQVEDELVLLCGPREPLTQEHLQRLAMHSVTHLYIGVDDIGPYFENMRNGIIALLTHAGSPSGRQQEEAFDLAAWGIRSILDSPVTQAIRHGVESLAHVIEAISLNTDLVVALARWVCRDPSQAAHAVAVSTVGTCLAREALGRELADLRRISAALLVHDIGMSTVPDRIIHKVGKLGAGEMQAIRLHPLAGLRLLRHEGCLTEEMQYVVAQHHERLDGSGYPRQLKGDQIHPLGSIAGIADVFSAMICDRPYRTKRTPYEALMTIRTEMLAQFGEDLYRRFVSMFERV